MNSAPQLSIPGNGGMISLTPIWYPPMQVKWIVAILVVFAAAVSDRLNESVRRFFLHPLGFFLTAGIGFAMYQYKFAPGALAVFFFLLMIWATQQAKEGFLSASNTIDWVTNSKRWYVEKALKERPLGIQEKDVRTYPIQDASGQASNAM